MTSSRCHETWAGPKRSSERSRCRGDRNQFFFGSGLVMAVVAMIAAFVVISLIHAYHPPGVALASIPVLLHPGHWFPLLVVLPFTAVAVGSAAAMSKWLRGWPVYPKSLRNCS
jgi:CBS-domain-containing membrane protein